MLSPAEKRYQETVLKIKEYTLHPPPDEVFAAHYRALDTFLHTNQQAASTLHDVLQTRKIEPRHLSSLLPRAFQFMILSDQQIQDYPTAFTQEQRWQAFFQSLSSNDDKISTLKNILLTKDVSTTVYQRQAGPEVIINALFSDTSLAVVDLGCGGNFGLIGMARNVPYEAIDDLTPGQHVTNALQTRARIREGMGIDLVDPRTEEARLWRRACKLPHEVADRQTVVREEEQFADADGINFLQHDILSLPVGMTRRGRLQTGHYTVVQLNTFCYQMSRKERIRALDKAKSLVEPNGVIIIQDYARKDDQDPKLLDVREGMMSEPFSYRTFVARPPFFDIREALQWENSRCLRVKAGADFPFLFGSSPLTRAA